MKTPTRREVLATLAVGSAAIAAGCATGASQAHSTVPAANATPTLNPSTTPAATPTPVPNTGDSSMTATSLAADHTPKPLPFAAGALSGLSERMIVSHHENNYGGAVRNLNGVEKELSRVTKDTPPFIVTGLRDRELTFRNSKTLHEQYFGNLGGDGKRSGAIETALTQAYGSAARWEEQFRVTGLGLGGGSGWVILGYELDTHLLRVVSCSNHTQSLASSVPLLVMDMYEHAYQMDYGAAAARYVDAFFANVSWDEVARRFERAQRAATALATSA
jgi:Fe-Mn family superoxide dismutase